MRLKRLFLGGVLSSLLFSYAYAQPLKSEYGAEVSSPNKVNFTTAFIGKSYGSYYLLKTLYTPGKESKVFLEEYDEELQLVSNMPISTENVEKKKTQLHSVLIVEPNVNVLSTYYDLKQGTRTLYVQGFEDNKVDKEITEVITVTTPKDQQGFFVIPGKDRMLIVESANPVKGSPLKMTFNVISGNLGKLSKSEVNIPSASENLSFTSFLSTIPADYVITELTGKGSDPEEYYVIRMGKSVTESDLVKIEAQDKFLNNLHITPYMDKLILTGHYSSQNDASSEGVFHQVFTHQDKQIKIEKFQAYPETYSSIYNESENSPLKGPLNFRGIRTDSEGSMFFISEANSYDLNFADAGYFNKMPSEETSLHYGDFQVVKFSRAGNLEWVKPVGRNFDLTPTKGFPSYMESSTVFMKQNRLFIFYIDNPANQGAPAADPKRTKPATFPYYPKANGFIVEIKTTGDLIKSLVGNSTELEMDIIPEASFQNSNQDIIIYASNESRNKSKFGKINVK